MASSVTEGHIKKLRKAGYLSNDIAHRLPDEGQLVHIVQVMLIRRILPCQQRAFNLWEFDLAQHQTLSRL